MPGAHFLQRRDRQQCRHGIENGDDDEDRRPASGTLWVYRMADCNRLARVAG
jgi:hypothetical protein